MDLSSAEKATRQGAFVGLVAAAIYLLITTVAIIFDFDGSWRSYNDPLNFAYLPFELVLAYLVYRRSRAAAVVLFLLTFLEGVWFANHFAELAMLGSQSVIILVAGTYLYFFGRALIGAFTYHRIRSRQDPAYRSAPTWSYILGSPFAIILALFLVAVTYMTLSDVQFEVVDQEQMYEDNYRVLLSNGIVREDEIIIMLHANGFSSVLDQGSILTNQRVIQYQEFDDEPFVYDVPYSAIADVTLEVQGDFWTDAEILVTTKDDDELWMYVSTWHSGDQRFLNELMARWKAATSNGQGPRPLPDEGS